MFEEEHSREYMRLVDFDPEEERICDERGCTNDTVVALGAAYYCGKHCAIALTF